MYKIHLLFLVLVRHVWFSEKIFKKTGILKKLTLSREVQGMLILEEKMGAILRSRDIKFLSDSCQVSRRNW